MHTAVTTHPVGEKEVRNVLRDIPVRRKKVTKTGIWERNTISESKATMTISTTRSVTTVPTDRPIFVPSYCLRIPHRSTSPTRGTTRLLA